MTLPLFSAANVKALRVQARTAMRAQGHLPEPFWVSQDVADVFKASVFVAYCAACHARVTVNLTTLAYTGDGLLPCSSIRTVSSDIGDILISGYVET